MQLEKRAEIIKDWIYTAANHLKENMASQMTVEEKSNRKDLVTNLDKETEMFFREQIEHHFPGEGILGEEHMGETITSLDGPVWIIDPIDGTANFVLQHNHFAIMIASFEDDVGQIGFVYDVMADTMLEAIKDNGVKINGQSYTLPFRDKPISDGLIAINSSLLLDNTYHMQEMVQEAMGLRLYGSAGLELISVVKGETLGYTSPHLQPWDIAAGSVAINELGLCLTQMSGEPIDFMNPNPVFVGYPSVYKRFRKQYETYKTMN